MENSTSNKITKVTRKKVSAEHAENNVFFVNITRHATTLFHFRSFSKSAVAVSTKDFKYI